MEFYCFTIPEEHIVLRSKFSFVFVNLRPFLKYHLLVSPYRKVQRIMDLTENEHLNMNLACRKVVKSISHLCEGFNLIIQDGKAAGQTVPHVHMHIVPRCTNDLANNNDVYNETNLDVRRSDRSFQEMGDEAEFLKKFLKAEDD